MKLSRSLVVKGGIVFAGCALAASFVIGTDGGADTAVQKRFAATQGAAASQSTAKNSPPPLPALDVSLLERAPAAPIMENVFAPPRPPAPPPPRARATEPPPKPSAPALPFQVLGTMIDRGATTLFLARGTENYSVKPGDVIDEVYRLEQLTETHATFVYLPLQERQTLEVRSGH